MSRNLVRQHRVLLSMTQRELAEKVGTSQQQIQRIETGKIAAKLGIAQTICTVLNKPLQVVFPEAEKSLTEFRNKGSQRDEDLSEVADNGIEMDAFAWTVKLY
ncbi:helix-turn-helix transcriptional regulator [Salmonella enterica]